MHLSGFDLFLWVAGLLAHIVLVAVLYKRRLASAFPVLTAFMSLNIVKTLTLFIVYRFASSYAYYYAYLSLDALDCTMQIVVAYEVALHVFRPAMRWSPGVRTSFAWLTASALVVSIALACIALPTAKYLSDTLLIRGNFLSAALMSELFVGMLALSVEYGLPWRTHAARIAQGFGAYSLVCIVIETLHTYFGLRNGTHAFRVISRVRVSSYLFVVIYWIVTLAREAPPERQIPRELQVRLAALTRRAVSIGNLLQGWRA